jgi:hypothetical protein
MLRALNDAIAYLRCMGVRHLGRKIAALKAREEFWQTLSEIYLATHFQRAGASVKEFDPLTSDGHRADFAFTLDDWSGIVEVHTVTPKEIKPTGILDPLEEALQDWRKKKRQLASNNPTTLRLFAQSVNLMEAEAQLLFLERDLFALPEAQTICQQAFEQGLDAIALFAHDPPSGLIWAIRWHWRPDRAGLPDQFPAFRDYPKRATMLERAVLKLPNLSVPIRDFFQATLLDYYEDDLLSPLDAVEAFNSHWLYKSSLTVEQFLHLAYEHGIPYFRMTEEDWRAEAEAMRRWEQRNGKVSR